MIPLAQARSMADHVLVELEPFCERIAVSGSIRRQRPFVNDLDLVILPQPGKLDQIKARCESRCKVITDGPQNYIVRMVNDVQLDIFIARRAQRDLLTVTPGNWGTLLLCRTGSKEHNIHLVEHAKRMGLTWKPYIGVVNSEGVIIAAEIEAEIIEALGLDWIPPEKRER